MKSCFKFLKTSLILEKHACTCFHLEYKSPLPFTLLCKTKKKRKKHWNFLNYEASIDQQFLTEIEHLIACLKVKSDCCGWCKYLHYFSRLWCLTLQTSTWKILYLLNHAAGNSAQQIQSYPSDWVQHYHYLQWLRKIPFYN